MFFIRRVISNKMLFLKYYNFLFSQLSIESDICIIVYYCCTLLSYSHFADIYLILKILSESQFVQKIVLDFQRISFKVKTLSLFSLFYANFNFSSKKVGRKVTFEIMNLKSPQICIFRTLKFWCSSH